MSLTSLVTLGVRSYKEKRFLETLPLLTGQFVSAFIWGCSAASAVGSFNFDINRSRIMKGQHYSLRNTTITFFLLKLIYLQPLNLFLYTWRFLRELEEEAINSKTKKMFRWFARIILLFPVSYLCILPAFIVAFSRADYYQAHLEPQEYKFYEQVSSKL